MKRATIGVSYVLFTALALLEGGAKVWADETEAARGPRLPTAHALGRGVFIENLGQWHRSIRYVGRAPGGALGLHAQGLVLRLDPGSGGQEVICVRLELEGGSEEVILEGRDEAAGEFHFLRGADGANRTRGARAYRRVIARGVYPGIDLVVREGRAERGEDRSPFEYDLILAPEADLDRVRIRCEGAKLRVDAGGFLLLETPSGAIRQSAPVSWQLDAAGVRTPVQCSFRLIDESTYGFSAPSRDHGSRLIIDPGLEWSTFVGGGSYDDVIDVAMDSSGAVFAGGETSSSDFPVTPGAFQTSYAKFQDLWIAKFDAGGQLVFSTFLGGSNRDELGSITLDDQGHVYLTGGTSSADYPVTPGAFDTSFADVWDVVVTKLDPTGSSLVFSTLLGGFDLDSGTGIALGPRGDVYVAGATRSSDFPTTPGAYDRTWGGGEGVPADVFVTRLSSDGSSLVYSTYIGGTDDDSARAIAVDGGGNAWITGASESLDYPVDAWPPNFRGPQDAIVTLVESSGSALIHSRYLGGSGDEKPWERGWDIALDGSGSAWIVGTTNSPSFPVTADAFDSTYAGGSHTRGTDGFLARIDGSGALTYASYLGGTGDDVLRRLSIGAAGDLYLTGWTTSVDFPATPGAFMTSYQGGTDAILCRFDPSGRQLRWSTFLGGSSGESGQGIARSSSAVAIAGNTASSDLPITPGAFDPQLSGVNDGFITVLRPGPVLAFHGSPSPGSSVHYGLRDAPSAETGAVTQVALSCSGTSGIPLPGGQVLPLTFDGCTSLGLGFSAILQGQVDAAGDAVMPTFTFPGVPQGVTVYSAAFTWETAGGQILSVTPPIRFVTQ